MVKSSGRHQGGMQPIDHRGGATTSDVFILDRVAQKMAAEKQMSFGTKRLNLDKPKITKALSVDDSSHLRLTKPLDVSCTRKPRFKRNP